LQWTRLVTATIPSTIASTQVDLTFDPDRGRPLLMVRGIQDALFLWSGSDWSSAGALALSFQPSRLAADPVRQVTLHFPATRVECRLTRVVAAAATASHYGSGCAIGPAPALHALASPRLGEAGFGIDLYAVSPLAPAVLEVGLATQDTPL